MQRTGSDGDSVGRVGGEVRDRCRGACDDLRRRGGTGGDRVAGDRCAAGVGGCAPVHGELGVGDCRRKEIGRRCRFACSSDERRSC